jgi:DNA polymerase-3 subunit alpha
MRDILRRYQPERIEDLCALNALYRPGPIQGGMVDDFIERKHGRRRVTYEFPELEPILAETYGVIVYQEQVMQVANLIAGYSLGEADLLRRAMGKKKAEEMAKQRARFMQGALERGFNEKKAGHLFDLMEQFAGYGFNKSHSAAYAFLAYITGYLKSHYPLEFMSALLTSETGNSDKIVKYINECREMGIKVLPPDVNKSGKDFTPDGDGIRFGLCAIKNVGGGAVDSIIRAREENGAFRSIYGFCESVDLGAVNRRILESLIKAGALDSLEGTRSQLFNAIDSAMDNAQRKHRDRLSGQSGLFADFGGAEEADPPLPKVPDWSQSEKLQGEKELLGFYVTGHPLHEWMHKITELATHDSESLEGLERGAEAKVCGIITNLARKRNKEGKLWASFQLEDLKGRIECMVFASKYDECLSQLAEDKPVFVRGTALPEEGAAPKLSMQSLVLLENARVDLPSVISIRVRLQTPTNGTAAELSELFARKPGDAQVRLRLEKPRDFSVILDVAARVRPDKEFRAEIERICGPESFEELAK